MTSKELKKTDNKLIGKKELNKVFARSFFYGASWNYERMQNLGFLYTITPVLKKLYGKSKTAMSKAMKRHLEFFNTHQSMAPFILGVTSALEEEDGNDHAETTTGIKIGLMGPLSGLGDSLIWLTLVPICMSLGASYAKTGNPLGLIVSLLLFNVINIPLKYFGLKAGYTGGSELIQKSSSKGTLDRITNMAIALGLVLVGGLIPQMVTVNLGVKFVQGGLTISLNKIINDIFTKILPLLVTLGIYKLIHKGKNPVILIFAIMALSILLVWLHILAK